MQFCLEDLGIQYRGGPGDSCNVGMVVATDCRVRQAEEKLKDHPWIVCLGLPNGTALWQVGDAAEQKWLLEDGYHKVQTGSSII